MFDDDSEDSQSDDEEMVFCTFVLCRVRFLLHLCACVCVCVCVCVRAGGVLGGAVRPALARRGGFLGSLLEDFLKLDMRKWLHLLQDLNLLPRVFGQDWTCVFLQKFGGTLTIVPYQRLGDYLAVIADPTRASMAAYMLGGERVTWPKLSMIANRVRIEQALQRAARASS